MLGFALLCGECGQACLVVLRPPNHPSKNVRFHQLEASLHEAHHVQNAVKLFVLGPPDGPSKNVLCTCSRFKVKGSD